MDIFGQTRGRLHRDYALITPDTHVTSPLVGWKNAMTTIHVSPEMGARFTQYTAHLQSNSRSSLPGKNMQRFIYVQEGSVQVQAESEHAIECGGFAFIPADVEHVILSSGPAKLLVFEKPYVPHEDFKEPPLVVGDSVNVPSEPFMGDEDARLQTLLPVSPEFDMAVNIFTYQPGAALPQVEMHVMEHGLLMLSGQGIYRLSNDYLPVIAGDVIWVASYCPQWFVAMGKTPASYIYYKDIHR